MGGYAYLPKPFELYDLVATIPLESKATSIAIDGSSLWVALFETSSVARIDTATVEVVTTIPNVPSPATVTVFQGAVWVANVLSNTVTRIDTTTNQIVATKTPAPATTTA